VLIYLGFGNKRSCCFEKKMTKPFSTIAELCVICNSGCGAALPGTGADRALLSGLG